MEIEGWNHLFDEDYEKATEFFQEALEIDSTNYTIYIGIVVIGSLVNDGEGEENLFYLIDKAAQGDEKLAEHYAYLAIAIIVDLEEPAQDRSNYTKKSIAEARAFLTDGNYIEYHDNGEKYIEGQYANMRQVGEWKYYHVDGGYLSKTVVYPDTGSYVTYRRFKSDGDIVELEIWDEDDLRGRSSLVKTIIYWQKVPGKIGEYLFVAKDGFCTYDFHNQFKLDENTPDNIIEEIFQLGNELKLFIWKNGELIPYEK
ncbi:MAG: hypothetical protein IIA45_12050 [Bacteroidetes bacterium]|nr:hypothetical protein [Bacteroidota bacterium]